MKKVLILAVLFFLPVLIFGFPSAEDLKKSCLAKKPGSCFLLGFYYDDGLPGKDFREFEFYKKGCNSNVGEACGYLGTKHEQTDIKAAMEYYEKGCSLNNGPSCATLGQVFYSGIGGSPIDKKKGAEYFFKAIPLLEKGCKNDSFMDCLLLYYLSEEDEFSSLVPPFKTFIKKTVELCKKDGLMCNFSAEYLEKYPNPELPSAESLRLRSIELRESLCEKMGRGCYGLGVELREGKNGIKDAEKALSLFLKACDNKNDGGCNDGGVLYDLKGDYIKARKLFLKACNLKNALGCSNLAKQWEHGQGGLVDYTEAIKYYLRSAELGNNNAPGYLGDVFKILIDADTTELGFGVSFYGSTQKVDTKIEAYMWYNIASALGNNDYAVKRDEMKSIMNAKQILSAQQKASRWMKTHRSSSK